MSLRFCANLSMMFGESPDLLDRYTAAKEAGFSAVECAFPYDFSAEQVAAAKEKAGLEQVLINAYPGNHLGFAAVAGLDSEFKESLKRSLKYCAALKCKRLHIMSGKRDSPALAGRSLSMETLERNLREAIPLLDEAGVVGLIEPINGYSVPGYFLNSFEDAERLIRSINSPSLRLQLDLFHLQFLKGDLTNNITRMLAVTGHLQVAQVPHRHEPDSDGEINYPYVFSVLKQLGYNGWIGLEYVPKNRTVDGLSWLKQMNDVIM